MKVLVIGAGGKTGKLIVERAIAAGHEVTALLHEAKDEKHEPRFPSRVEVIHGDARNPARLDQVMAGQHAVIDAIGGPTPWKKTELETDTAKTIIEIMKRNNVSRLIAISVVGEGESKTQAGFFYEHILMPTLLHGAMPDKAGMEAAIEHSGLDFVIVRPPTLSDTEATGQIRILEPHEHAHRITRADLAQFIVDQITGSTFLGQAVTIANT